MKSNHSLYRRLALLLTVLIFAMAYYGRTVQQLIQPVIRNSIFFYISLATILVFMSGYYTIFLRRFGLLKVIAHICCCLIICVLCWKNLLLPIERFHLIEYALLATCLMLAQRQHSITHLCLTTWFLTTLVGISDELVQSFSPGRICDVRDMAINSTSGLLGVIFAAPIRIARQ